MSRYLLRHEAILAVLLVLALAVLAMQSDRFFTVDNLLNQGRLMAEVGLVALAMTFVIVTAGIDLSVGSILGLVAILLGVFWQKLGIPLPLAMFLGVVVGGVAGLFNGIIITRFRVPPLIATLATLALYRGLAEGISQARSVRGYPEWFFVLGQGEVLGVPTQLWIFLACAVVAAIVLGMSTFGRATYATGANIVAARFSGIPVDRTILLIYTASGLHRGLGCHHLRVAGLDHALRHGHGPRARRHHRGGAGRHQHLRRARHHHRHLARTHPDAGAEERPGIGGREGRRHDRGDRPHPDRDDHHQQSGATGHRRLAARRSGLRLDP